MSETKVNDTIIKMVNNLKPNIERDSNDFSFASSLKRSFSSASNGSQTSSEESVHVKKLKLDLNYMGSPREMRRLRTDLLEARNTILNLESRIQHMHSIRKELEIMYENETKALKKQHENDRHSIEELEAQMQNLRQREANLKEELAELNDKYSTMKVRKDEEIEELEKSLSEMKEESRLFDGEENSEIISLNRRVGELQMMLDAAEEDAEAQKKLVAELVWKAGLYREEAVNDRLSHHCQMYQFVKYLLGMEKIDDSNQAKSDVQSTNQLVLPPRDDGATAFLNDVVPQVESLQNEHPKEQHVASCVSAMAPPQTIALRMEVPLAIETPSTSTAQDVNVAKNRDDLKDFDLISYLHDITNVPVDLIVRECKVFNVSPRERPHARLLATMVDCLLKDQIGSGSGSEDLAKRYDITKPSTSGNGNKVAVAILPESKGGLIHPKEENVIDLGQAAAESDTDVDVQLVDHLCCIFPDACPTYIKRLCRGKTMSNEVLDDITTIILNCDESYPKRPQVNVDQMEILKELFPDADPDYLRMKCDQFEGRPERIRKFINKAMERRNYPTLKEYLRRQQLSAQEKQYTSEFNVENFIKIIPNPHEFFSDPARVVKMDSLSTHCALVFLKNTFDRLLARTIKSTFTKQKWNLYKTYKELQHITKRQRESTHLKSVRKPVDMPNSVQNIPLLQEIAYCSHIKEINSYLNEMKEKEVAERQEALDQGLMKTCGCCYDEEVLPKEIFTCESNCEFCKNCIVKSTQVRFGDGKLDFPCLANCSSNFSLQTLQAVLSPKLFSKIAQKKALEEVKAAGIEELETCPFCDFATIPAEGYNIFTCMNPECMKESCRVCKQPSHIPLRCDEIEKDEDVKARVFVENKMTEALLKKCWRCGLKFFKEEGCNKMTCSCGACMCYVCGKPVADYKHFNGNGGDRFDLCPLFSDTNTMNKENVLKAAAAAKTEIGNKELKHDPTAGVEEHYKERAKKLPPPPIVQPGNAQNALAAFIRMLGEQNVEHQRHLHNFHHQQQ